MKPIVKVRNITKYYNDLHVLDKISFNVDCEEFVSIIGPSGCGKTTLLKIISGLIKPTKGEIIINEGSIEIALKRKEFGLVFQNPVLLPWRNTLKNIELPLEILNYKSSGNSSKKLLEIVGLKDFENFYPNELSGGMQQRVAIARALIFEPSILLMDEPFGALDEITRDKMNLELLRIWKERKSATSTIIFVTHSIPEAVFLSDRIIVLSERPAIVEKIIEVNLPKPRTSEIKYSRRYIELIKCIRKLLKKD
ncbi:MAG: ABC transporter ATP-binding protein [Patescibacteria group bacterium]